MASIQYEDILSVDDEDDIKFLFIVFVKWTNKGKISFARHSINGTLSAIQVILKSKIPYDTNKFKKFYKINYFIIKHL